MKLQSLLLLLLAAAFLSLSACKKEVDTSVPNGGKSIDPMLLGKWGWYSFYTRLFDEAGNEQETPSAFYYGRDDVQYDYKDDGTYTMTTDDGNYFWGKWTIKNGKLLQDGTTTYEYSFEDNNRTLILKNVEYLNKDGERYRQEQYSVLSRDWLP